MPQAAREQNNNESYNIQHSTSFNSTQPHYLAPSEVINQKRVDPQSAAMEIKYGNEQISTQSSQVKI